MSNTEIRQVIVVRKDLKMRKGKLAAQVAHASMKVILDLMHKDEERDHHIWTLGFSKDTWLDEWLNGLFTKIVVGCSSEEELINLHLSAEELHLSNAVITDSGATEFGGVPTKTCLAIGPAPKSKFKGLTDNLPLL